MTTRLFLTILAMFTMLDLAIANPESKPGQNKFRFLINADPQMGPKDTGNKGLKVLNELLKDFVHEVNEQHSNSPIEFVVYNGDLVWKPQPNAFDHFTNLVGEQKPPVVLVHGNHDGVNDDPQFFKAQKKLSGYEKLNYSFSRGEWQFIVIGSQEKYLSSEKKAQQLTWLRNELATYKDKKVMMFMHYHMLPVGLSQMEYYTYYPVEFRRAMLDTITQHGNVKYAFSGHVHAGVKASIKSSMSYKGTQFINCPTPVMARPFGEEFEAYEDHPNDRYFRRGFYLEVLVDGDQVQMKGRKIKHEHVVDYPDELKSFDPSMDPRYLVSESKTVPNEQLVNGGFDEGFNGWDKSFRYEKDNKNAFKNTVKNGVNILRLNAPWGSWSFDEYMETYQVVKFNSGQENVLQYDFRTPRYRKNGGGGYIKLNFFDQSANRRKMLLLHWGSREEKVKLMYRSWFFNADGDRAPLDHLNEKITSGEIVSIPIEFDDRKRQLLDIDLNQILSFNRPEGESSEISHLTISHGVWSRISMHGTKFWSELAVSDVQLKHDDLKLSGPIMLNNINLSLANRDQNNPYFNFD